MYSVYKYIFYPLDIFLSIFIIQDTFFNW